MELKDYKELYESLKNGSAERKGFLDLNPAELKKFIKTFSPSQHTRYTSTESPIVLTCDFKIQEGTGKPYLIEMERVPGSFIGTLGAEGPKYPLKEYVKVAGYNRFISLKNLIKTWRGFDLYAELDFAPHISVIADEKVLTHRAFGCFMPRLVDANQAKDDSLLVAKLSYSSRGRDVFIAPAKEQRRFKTYDTTNNFCEELILGEPHREGGKEFENCFRSVFLIGMKKGVPAIAPIVTYSRVSPIPRDADADVNDRLKVNVGNSKIQAIPLPASDRETELLTSESLKVLGTLLDRVKEGFRMSDVLEKPYLFNLARVDLTFGEEYMHEEARENPERRKAVLENSFKDWAVYLPERWSHKKSSSMIFGNPTGDLCADTFIRMINIHQPEVVVANYRQHVVVDHGCGEITLEEGEKIPVVKIKIPKERIVVIPEDGLSPQKLEEMIESAKKASGN